jgi:hypothetical protein
MDRSALIFMAASWAVILATTIFCLYRLEHRKK